MTGIITYISTPAYRLIYFVGAPEIVNLMNPELNFPCFCTTPTLIELDTSRTGPAEGHHPKCTDPSFGVVAAA